MKLEYLIAVIITLISIQSHAMESSGSKNYVGRYVYSTGTPQLPEHIDPLNQQYSASFVPSATYSQAINRLLEQAGYEFTSPKSKKHSQMINKWINRRLAPHHRELGLMEISRLIEILHGVGWALDVDKATKTASLKAVR